MAESVLYPGEIDAKSRRVNRLIRDSPYPKPDSSEDCEITFLGGEESRQENIPATKKVSANVRAQESVLS